VLEKKMKTGAILIGLRKALGVKKRPASKSLWRRGQVKKGGKQAGAKTVFCHTSVGCGEGG